MSSSLAPIAELLHVPKSPYTFHHLSLASTQSINNKHIPRSSERFTSSVCRLKVPSYQHYPQSSLVELKHTQLHERKISVWVLQIWCATSRRTGKKYELYFNGFCEGVISVEHWPLEYRGFSFRVFGLGLKNQSREKKALYQFNYAYNP